MAELLATLETLTQPLREIDFANNALLTWLIAMLTFVAVFVALKVLRFVGKTRLVAWAKRNSTELDDLVVHLLVGTRALFFFMVALYAGLSILTLPPTLALWRERLFVLVLIVQIGIWGVRALNFLVADYGNRANVTPGTKTTLSAMQFLGKLVLFAILALALLDNFGFNVTALAASLGIAGLAVGLALQNILGDLFSSLSIVLDKPFEIGDFIIVDDMLGTIERIGLRSTRVRSLSGEQLIFTNRDLLDSRIRNFKRMQERRVVFTIGVTYGTPTEKLERIPAIIRGAIERQDKTRFDRSHFFNYGAFSLDFETVYFVLEPDFMLFRNIQQAVNLEIYAAFEREGISFAFPTQTIHLQQTPAPRPPEVLIR
jgi:small-conductance mechanosensitive channel